MYGLSRQGFKPKEFSKIKEEIQNAFKKEIDPHLHFESSSIAGVLVDIIAHQSRQVWEVLAALYHSLQPDSASGEALNALCSLTGTYRKKADFTKAKAIFTLNTNTTLPAESRIKTVAGDFFKTTAKIKNDTEKVIEIEVDLIAEEVGPKLSHDGSIAEIMTPVAGWSKAVMGKTYELGRSNETDEELRSRRLIELRASGTSTLSAIKSRLLQLSNVEAVYIKENCHSFEVVIKGGKPKEIANTLWLCKPIGIKTEGKEFCEIIDSMGQKRVIKFSRPEVIPLKMEILLKTKKELNNEEITKIKIILINFAVKNFRMGKEIYPSHFYEPLLKQSNILDVISLNINSTTKINFDQIPSLNIGDIDVDQRS